MSEEKQLSFFWRDVQTLRGALRCAFSRPSLDIGELRAIEANGAFTAPVESSEMTEGAQKPERLSLQSRQFRDLATAQALSNLPNLRELFSGAMQRQMRVVA